LRALVVDDARVQRRVLASLLTSLGHEMVAEAATVQEAVAAALRTEPDVVLLDAAIEPANPEEPVLRLREVCPAAAVIACGSPDSAALVACALKAGACDAVARPFVRSLLGEALARLG
jgi:CheY-like chemotaxis protein